MRSIKKLIRVQKVDILRDSLDVQDNLDESIAKKVKAGHLPKSMFCLVDKTGELIDVEFDEFHSKLYINYSSKEYYRPI